MNRIDEIENGLRLAVEIEGELAPRMSIEERMAHYHVPGISIALIDGGEVAWSKAYGLAKVGEQAPVTANTLFQAASVSKPVAALAAMSLVQAGVLDLDRDVNEVLKSWTVPENEFTATEKVTLRRLLSHNAGLTVHGFPGYAAGADLPNVLQVLRGEPPANTSAVFVDATPGTLWRYSGGGTTVAQLLMMEATGQPFAEIMREFVLEPLGMSLSTYEQPLPIDRWGETAAAHQGSGEPYPGDWHTYPELAAAGLWTTPEDLSKVVLELQKSYLGQSNRIISQELTREMLKVQFGDWGIGFKLDGEGEWASFSHGGSNAGFRCNLHGFLHNGQGLVVMTNGDNGGNLVGEVNRSVAAVYGWPDFSPAVKQTIPLSNERLAQFTGSYALVEEASVLIEFTLEDGSLMCFSEGFLAQKIRLYPQSDASFFDVENGMEFQFSFEEPAPILTLRIQTMAFHAKRID